MIMQLMSDIDHLVDVIKFAECMDYAYAMGYYLVSRLWSLDTLIIVL